MRPHNHAAAHGPFTFARPRTTRRFPQSDPGDEQPALFPDPPVCTAKDCGAYDRRDCLHDADIAAGIRDPYARRPRTCLNSFQLGPDDELPF